MKPVLPDAVFHVVASEPDGATASKRRIAGGKHNLFVCPHS
jgi:hypothetical protein